MNEQSGRAPLAHGPWSNLVLGLKVLGGELKWLLLKGLREWELRQLRKRLREERALLGEAVERLADPADLREPLAPDQDMETALRQVAFLRDEIALLEQDRDRMREDFQAGRRQQFNLPDPDAGQ